MCVWGGEGYIFNLISKITKICNTNIHAEGIAFTSRPGGLVSWQTSRGFSHPSCKISTYYLKLLSFTKPTKCTYNLHNSIVFYHSNMFRHYCAIRHHQGVLAPSFKTSYNMIYYIRNICIYSIPQLSLICTVVTYIYTYIHSLSNITAMLCVHPIILTVSTKHVKI